jgi:hypothetical protein
LDAVLRSITGEKSRAERNRRANAVLSTLAKAWDRLGPYAEVPAVLDYSTWQERGQVSACWLFSAAAIAWLSDANGLAAPPLSLKRRSPGNLALHGSDPAIYLHSSHDDSAWHRVLESLGIHGDPRSSELTRGLEDVRAVHPDDPAAAQDAAAPLYQALAQQIPVTTLTDRSMGDLSRREAIAAFGRDQGLIATNHGWLRPSSVLSGPPIFGDYRAFVPAVSGTDRLWRLLGVRAPSFDDARDVIRELAKDETLDSAQHLVMLESLRLMSKSVESGSSLRRKNLSRTPVWTGHEWTTRRPVFAVANRQLAEALELTATVWKPGGDIRQFDALVELLALTRLDENNVRIVGGRQAVPNDWAAEVFARAVRNLQADLSMNDPGAERALALPWDELVSYEVRVLPGLRLEVTHPQLDGRPSIHVGAWIDQSEKALYLEGTSEAGRASTGGNAIASLFRIEARRVAQAWMAAWSDGEAGYRAEVVTLASRRAADDASKRDAANQNRLHELRLQANAKRGRGQGAAPKAQKPGLTQREVPNTPPRPARTLVDPSSLTIRNPNGTLQDRQQLLEANTAQHVGGSSALRLPDRSNPKKLSTGRGPVNYTPEERESVGLALVRHVLGGEEAGIVDIRNQHNVGADAIDDLQRFFELKVYHGAIPNVVRLTNSEVQRALNTEDFFLVLVGHVEQGTDQPEVRILTDPLTQLSVEPTGSIHLSGVYNAQALVYSFGTQERSPGEELTPDFGAIN